MDEGEKRDEMGVVAICENVKIMLKQHIGVTATPVVSVGDAVQKGQLIASCSDAHVLGANIHSSMQGCVVAVDADAIKIKCDDVQPADFVKIPDTTCNLEAIRHAGIVGAGGAGFPAHVKFNTDLAGGCIILNAAECEPTLFHNIRVLEYDAAKIVRGMGYVMEITNAAVGYIAIKPKNKAAVIAVAKACKAHNNNKDIQIKYLPDLYPAGDERVVVREVLGIELTPGQLPLAAGAIVSNVETVKRVCEAIELRKPVITKDFTVGGRLAATLGAEPVVYLDQPIGVAVGHYISDCGGFVAPRGEIVLGGPFTGESGTENDVVTKTLGGIFAANPFLPSTKKFGILICECGADEGRLREIVAGMGGTVVAQSMCKRMIEVGGRWRCEKPGACPGQAEVALKLRKEGAEAIISSACED